MSNTIDALNILDTLTSDIITATSISCNDIEGNLCNFDNVRATNLYCDNILLDISQNLNLSGSLSCLNIGGNVVSCNSINTNQIIRTSDGEKYATIKDISNCYNTIIDGAPGALDTLKEIATSLNNETQFSLVIYQRIGKIDTSYNNVILPRFDNVDLSYNTTIIPRFNNVDTSLNTLTSNLSNKLTNVINQDLFITGNVYIYGDNNKFIQFLNNSNQTMSSIRATPSYTTFNNSSSLISGGWTYNVNNSPVLNIDNNGNINSTNGNINTGGSVTMSGNCTANKFIFNGNIPSTVNSIQRGIAKPLINGNFRVQFSGSYPTTPSVTATPIYTGEAYLLTILITAIDTSGFNFNVFRNSTNSSNLTPIRFEQYCEVSWIAVG